MQRLCMLLQCRLFLSSFSYTLLDEDPSLGSRGYFFLSILMVRGQAALTGRKAPREKNNSLRTGHGSNQSATQFRF